MTSTNFGAGAFGERERTAAAAFGVRPIENQTMSGGMSGTSWRLSCGSGEFVLKRFHPRHDDVRLLIALEIRRAAASAMLSEAPLRAMHGGSLVTVDGGRYALMPFIEGKCATPTLATTAPYVLAGSVGRLHRALALLPSPDDPRHEPFNDLSPDKVEAALADLRGSVRSDPQILSWLRRKIEPLNTLVREGTFRASGLRRQWIHGDLQPSNLVRSPRFSGNYAIIDYDNACWGPTSYEVARAYLSCISLNSCDESLRSKLFTYTHNYYETVCGNRLPRESFIITYLWYQLCELLARV